MSEDFTPFEIIDGDLTSGILLLCDHARNILPRAYGTLGLSESEFERHIAYDIGAEALTRALAARLAAPAVHTCFSRLLIDPNRGEDDPTIVMRLSDGTVVPGNHPISREEIAHRISNFHAPYHNAIEDVIESIAETGTNPIIFSIHSFTPSWKGIERPWHATMLWDADPRLPLFMVEELAKEEGLIADDNEPYDGALKNDTMYQHATNRGLAQGLIEVRQDLIADEQGVEEWADRLAPILVKAIARPDMHEIRYYGSRTDGTAANGDYT